MSSTAVEWRKKGNNFFQQKNYLKALDCYTQSILVASRSTVADSNEDLALAFANRSAALFYMNKFKICLQDIELALDHGYPNNMQYKLHQRKGLCLMHLGLLQEAELALQDAIDAVTAHQDISPQKRSSLQNELQVHLQNCMLRNLVSSDQESSTKLDGDQFNESDVIANACGAVCMKYCGSKGRYLMAKSEISAGSIVIQELPYASVLLPEHNHSHCHFCHRRLVAPIPCSKCVWALYCSKLCLQSAREEHHLIECPHRKLLLQLGTFAWLSLRILLHAKKEMTKSGWETWINKEPSSQSTIPGCEPDDSYKASYHAVCSLMPHSRNHMQQELDSYQQKTKCLIKTFGHHLLLDTNPSSNETPEENEINTELSNLAVDAQTDCDKAVDSIDQSIARDAIAHEIGQSRTSECIKPVDSQDGNADPVSGAANFPKEIQANSDNTFGSVDQSMFNDKLILHMKQLKCNAHAITSVEPVKTDSSRGRLSEMVTTTEQVRLATAVYPTASLMNHSCVPNVIASFDGRRLVVRAIRTIKVGEEILHCYGPHAKHMDKAARRKALQEQYFFTCDCAACDNHTDDSTSYNSCDISKAYKCPHCDGPIEALGNGHLKCDKCHQAINERLLKQQEHRGITLFAQALQRLHGNDFEGCLSVLRQCYEIRTKVLYKYHKDIAETQDCVARCYASLGRFDKAGEHLVSSLDVIEKIFGDESIEVANELHKLAQIYFSGQEVEKAQDVIDKALGLFTLHYGGKHECVEELNQMKMCLTGV